MRERNCWCRWHLLEQILEKATTHILTAHCLPRLIWSHMDSSMLSSISTRCEGPQCLLFMSHTLSLEAELLSRPCPEEWEARAWGLQEFLKTQRTEVVACILVAAILGTHLTASILPTFGFSPLWEEIEHKQKEGGKKELREGSPSLRPGSSCIEPSTHDRCLRL